MIKIEFFRTNEDKLLDGDVTKRLGDKDYFITTANKADTIAKLQEMITYCFEHVFPYLNKNDSNHALLPIRFVNHFLLQIDLIQKGAIDNEKGIVCLLRHNIEFRWIMESYDVKAFNNSSTSDAYCSYNLAMQLSSLSSSSENYKLDVSEEDMKVLSTFPHDLNAANALLQKELDETIPLVHYKSVRNELTSNVQKLIEIHSQLLEEGKDQRNLNEVAAFADVYTQGVLFMKGVPMLMFVETAEKDSRTVALNFWKNEYDEKITNYFTIRDIEHIYRCGHNKYAGCLARSHFFYQPLPAKDLNQIKTQFNEFISVLAKFIISKTTDIKNLVELKYLGGQDAVSNLINNKYKMESNNSRWNICRHESRNESRRIKLTRKETIFTK